MKNMPLKTTTLLSQLAAEFIGSMFLVTVAIASMIMLPNIFGSDFGISVFVNAVTVAFTLFALIEMFQKFSGAHFNPLVTLIALCEGNISKKRTAGFIIVQFLGGICGTLLTRLMYFDTLGTFTAISETSRTGFVLVGEIVGSFILILAILLLTQVRSGKTSLAIATLVGGMVMTTSSHMFANPQVTVARMFTNTYAGIRPADAVVFIIMQIVGAGLAYIVYRLCFKNAVFQT